MCAAGRRPPRRAVRADRGDRDPSLPAAPCGRRPARLRARVRRRRCGGSAGSCAGSAATRRFDVVHACNPPDFLLLAALRPAPPGRPLRVRPPRPGARAVPVDVRRAGRSTASRSRSSGSPSGSPTSSIATNELLPADRARARPHRGRTTCSSSATVPTSSASAPPSPTPRCGAGASTCSPTSGSWGRRTARPRARARSAGSARGATTGTRCSSARATCSTRCARSRSSSGSREHVEFAGWRYDDDIRAILSTADVCLAPDPPSPLNDVSTMIKIPEYMAMGRAIVSYDLTESRVSAGTPRCTPSRATSPASRRCIDELLDDPELRARMGELRARARRARAVLAALRAGCCSPPTSAPCAAARRPRPRSRPCRRATRP